jgi:hypothetical protein
MNNDITTVSKLKSILIKKYLSSICHLESNLYVMTLTFKDNAIMKKIGFRKKYYRSYFLLVKTSNLHLRKKVWYEEKDSIKEILKMVIIKKPRKTYETE